MEEFCFCIYNCTCMILEYWYIFLMSQLYYRLTVIQIDHKATEIQKGQPEFF